MILKWYLVVYVLGEVGVVVGPLPYSGEECWKRVPEFREPFSTAAKTGLDKDGKPLAQVHIDAYKSMRFECVYSPQKPKLGTKQ